jgi:hypothetical protein
MTYGASINVGPTSDLDEVDASTLNDDDLARLVRLVEREETNVTGSAANPKVESKGERLKRLNAERVAKLAESQSKRAAMPGVDLVPPKPSREASGRMKGPAVKDKQCKCGCGKLTAGYFYPGHDARFKGWLLKIERGVAKPEDLLTPEVRSSYTWRKTEKGLIPTLNYRGEPHPGYEK